MAIIVNRLPAARWAHEHTVEQSISGASSDAGSTASHINRLTASAICGIVEIVKPPNWTELSEKEQQALALELLNSPRGYYLMHNALLVGAASLRAVGQESDAEDIDMIAEAWFSWDYENQYMAKISLSKIESEPDDD